MTKKRRNAGRSKNGRGSVTSVSCSNCGASTPKDKAIKRYTIRNIADGSSRKDITEALVNKNFAIPKLYYIMHYCVSCAVHSCVVRSRAVEKRKIRHKFDPNKAVNNNPSIGVFTVTEGRTAN